MVEIPYKKIIDFFRGIVPFNELPHDVLNGLPQKIVIDYFPKESLILEQDGPPCNYLYIIETGAVEKTVRKDGVDILLEYRTEGEFFGSASLINVTGPAFSVRAHEDTVCYLLPKETFDELMQNHVGFHEHFAIRVSKLAYRLRKAQTGIFASRGVSDTVVFRSDGYLFNVTAGELVKRKPVTCSPYHEVAFVAKLMAREGVGSVVVVDVQNRPLGIVTKSDMTNRILAAGKTGSEPIRTVMSAPVLSVVPWEPCFSALLKMARFNCHHICVVLGELLQGVISQHDFIVLQGSNPLAVMNDIQKQTTVQGVAQLIDAMDRTVKGLLSSGVSARDIATFISEYNDRLTRRIIALTEGSLREEGPGRPPVPYCWLALGSEGRKEQTLRTDQDNAIIYSDPEPGSDQDVHEYFLRLAQGVVSGLQTCGFPLCKGGIMASNPRWCQPETVWRRYFSSWINKATPEDLRNSTIFFDFRPLAGASVLAQRLRAFLNHNIEKNRAFLRHLTTNALYNGPPLGFLRALVVEKTGAHKNQLNLKMSGLVPVVDAIRVLSLSEQINATNTLNRLELITRKKLLSKDMAEDIKEAFNFIMLLRINHHMTQKEKEIEPSDYIDPRALSKLQERSLIEAFHVIRDLQGELKARFPESI
ncbi:MAG: cyclic nucleotide-binding/CBS domain-containing protein [Deltaproteobacteria bacterium]|nr:cyclic nucleotide-binding/CBS domain-containing protein [Deltaproteobacteria bacterium]MBW1792890.1 cyclic nucleotide-binding/CBS domain-containing protein [Deltaproteobacteria bacterium]